MQPKVTEKQVVLNVSQKAEDRHNIIACTFCIKKMITLLTKDLFLDQVCVICGSGRNRALLIRIFYCDRIMSANIDKVISAEIPDLDSDPGFYDKVIMIHSSYG